MSKLDVCARAFGWALIWGVVVSLGVSLVTVVFPIALILDDVRKLLDQAGGEL